MMIETDDTEQNTDMPKRPEDEHLMAGVIDGESDLQFLHNFMFEMAQKEQQSL